MPRLSKVGAAALAAFGWTGLQSVTASYLVVAGGGGGAYANSGGGGGYTTNGTTSLNSTLSYTVTVGAGGAAGSSGSQDGVNGSQSAFSTFTANGGYGVVSSSPYTGGAGGSGGGGYASSGAAGAGGTNGSNGGTGVAAGGAGQGTTTTFSISGTSTVYSGGGGGGAGSGTRGAGGAGGGGNGASTSSGAGTSGTANLGGGGGGGNVTSGGGSGAGGSGIVIISYSGAQQFSGGVVTSSGGNTIHTFNTSGTLGPVTPLSANYLVVAGGGGGGNGGSNTSGGGGGAGGYRTGSGLTIDPNSTYIVTVGSGGAGGAAAAPQEGTAGTASAFLSITSAGGGYGSGDSETPAGAGGSGGGGGRLGAGGAASPAGQGNAGGTGTGATYYLSGGGGGAGAAGTSASGSTSGNGGAGLSSSISNTSVAYAMGAGGSGSGFRGGSSGTSPAGAGTPSASSVGGAGTANLGAGGGGGFTGGGAGGSGVVIISYAGSTQLMAGGVVTIAGGNVIHTFNSSGFLTPLTLLTNSLRFRSSASAYLNRTFGTPTNNIKWTWSGWLKRGILGNSTTQCFFGAGNNSNTVYAFSGTNSSDNFDFYSYNGGTTFRLTTTAVFRDPAAWYHVVFVCDTNNATSGDRVQLWVNGVRVTSFSTATYPSLGAAVLFNDSAQSQTIGLVKTVTYNTFLDGYLAEVNFIDGQALTPSSFGTTNSYGVWQPITYGGSYGTNGFRLPFTNNASTTTLGYDFSPQGNNWTTNNISLTAGVTYDSMTDVPTLTSATAANYCTLNPINAAAYSTTVTITNGNLTTSQGSTYILSIGTIAVSSGKWYWEVTSFTGSYPHVGITNAATPTQSFDTANTWQYAGSNGNKVNSNTGVAYGATYTGSDVIGVALDMDAGTLTFYKNNTSQGTAYNTGLTGITVVPSFASGFGSSGGTFNFGQRPFTYTAPSGFVALNTFNL